MFKKIVYVFKKKVCFVSLKWWNKITCVFWDSKVKLKPIKTECFVSHVWIIWVFLSLGINLVFPRHFQEWCCGIREQPPSTDRSERASVDARPYSGLLQSLSALCAPAPQVLEQWDQGDQRPQPPGMLSGFFPTVIHFPAIHHCKEMWWGQGHICQEDSIASGPKNLYV